MLKKFWKILMTTHIFGIYITFIGLAFFTLIISVDVLKNLYGDSPPKIFSLITLILVFTLLGFPGIISIIRKEYIRPIGQTKSGWMSVASGAIYAITVYGILFFIIITYLSK